MTGMRRVALVVAAFFIFTMPKTVAAQESVTPPSTSTTAQSPNADGIELSFGLGLLALLQDDTAAVNRDAAPTPLLASPSVAFSWLPLRPRGEAVKSALPFSLGIEADADFYMTHYKWSAQQKRPLAAEVENRSAFVLGSVVALNLLARYKPFSRIGFRLYGGAAGDFRIVMAASGVQDYEMEEVEAETEKIRDYFWENGRFIFVTFGFGAEYDLAARWAASLDCRVYLPITRDETLSAPDGTRLALTVRVILR